MPGTPAGWEKALRKYGSWRFKQVLAPAIDVARKGFVVDPTFTSQTDPNVPWFDDIPATAAIYLDPDGTSRDPGEVVKNPDMARTYERIARYGAKRGFYRGPVAEALVERRAASAHRADRRQDLAARPDHRARPAQLPRGRAQADAAWSYRGLDVFSMGPPSCGGSTVGEALNILERIPGYEAMPEIDKLHYFLEASRYAFADRNVFVADPDYFRRPAARAAVGLVRGRARGADRPDRPERGGPGRRSRTTTRARARPRRRSSRPPSRRRTSRSPTSTGRS